MRGLRPLALLSVLAVVSACTDTGSNPDDTATDTDTSDTDANAELIGILINPERVVLPLGESVQLKVTGLNTDRSSSDLTNVVTWGTSDASVVQVSDALDQEGLITGHVVGTAKIWAETNGIRSPEVKVKVTDATLLGLTVEPKTVSIEADGTLQLLATAAFSDGNRSDASAQVQWITDDGSVARLEAGGLLTGRGVGSTTIVAEWGGTTSEPIPVTIVEAAAPPDLVVAEVIGETSPDSVTLTVTVENNGDVGLPFVWVDVFVDPNFTPGSDDNGDEYISVPYIDANDYEDVGFQIPLTVGQHTLVIVVDSPDEIEEADESNNQVSLPVTVSEDTPVLPNLSITYFEFLADEASIYYAVDVYNGGAADAGKFFIDAYVDQTTAPVVPSDGDEWLEVPSLAAGDTTFADFLFERQCSNCTSWLLIDSLNNVEESDETDNWAGPVSVSN